MDYLDAFAISASGMAVERLRLDVAAGNLANMHSTGSPGAAPYQPLRVMSAAMTAARAAQAGLPPIGGVQVQGVVPMPTAPRMVYDPGNPVANDKGFVSYPGVDHLHEMTTVMTALRAYEANVAAMNAAKSMAARALEIGGQ